MINRYAAVLTLMLGTAVGSFAQSSQGADASLGGIEVRGSQPNTPLPLQQHYPRYLIKRQDVLTLSFPLSPELNQTVTVQPDGYINLQGIAGIHVEGLTAPEVATELKNSYSTMLKNPIITVDIKDFQKPDFTVLGEVGKPGRYELRSATTVAEALAVAGGLAPTAKTNIYLFRRTSADWFTVEKIDTKQLFKGKNLKDNALIQPGDMVIVPESSLTTFRKYVPYSIGASYLAPGAY